MKLRRRASFLVCAGLAAGPAAVAQPVGGEFRVNTYTSGTQRNARAALDTAGRFVVVWESSGEDGSGYGIYAQRFAAAGTPEGVPFRVNTYTSSNQLRPSVAVNPATGAFFIAWNSPGADVPPGVTGVYAQRYDAAGNTLGGEFRVNTNSSSNQDSPNVASDGSGNFLVSWASLPATLAEQRIAGQLFDASGARVGGQLGVSASATTGNPFASADGNGNFVVVWEDGTGRVSGRRLDPAGQPRGPEFLLNTGTTGVERFAGVAADRFGGFVAVWSSGFADPVDHGGGVSAQRFGNDESRLGAVFHVNTYTTNFQHTSRVVSDSAGNFVVCWTGADAALGTSTNVQAQRYRSSGAPIGGETRVNTTVALMQEQGGVAANAAGAFVVIWESSADGTKDIYAQRFAPISRHGDADGNGVLDINDVFYLINALYAHGAPPLGTADADGNGFVDVNDVFYLINYLFAGGPAPK